MRAEALEDRAKLKLKRDMGAELLAELNHPQTVELFRNPDGQVWVERAGEKSHPIALMPNAQAQAVIETVAGYHKLEVHQHYPLVEAQWPLDGSRFAGQIPPIVPSPTFCIRRRALRVFKLSDYLASNIISEVQHQVLVSAVRHHKNILVVGGTGSGKTTLLNALIAESVRIRPTERVIIIEDTGEIQCSADNCVQLTTTSEISMTQLLRASLRMRPDRILVGEVRGPESLDLLKAWNTGHEGGLATIHANDARSGLRALEMRVREALDAPKVISNLIAEVVHLVVFISRTQNGRRVQDIVSVEGYVDGEYITHKLG